jgi:hypothetical protein
MREMGEPISFSFITTCRADARCRTARRCAVAHQCNAVGNLDVLARNASQGATLNEAIAVGDAGVA